MNADDDDDGGDGFLVLHVLFCSVCNIMHVDRYADWDFPGFEHACLLSRNMGC